MFIWTRILICSGAEMIRSGKADVMIVGGAESAICPVGIAGFSTW